MYLGGAICIYGSVCDNLTSTFSNNEAVYHDGGAIYIDDSVYGDLNSTFNNNKAYIKEITNSFIILGIKVKEKDIFFTLKPLSYYIISFLSSC